MIIGRNVTKVLVLNIDLWAGSLQHLLALAPKPSPDEERMAKSESELLLRLLGRRRLLIVGQCIRTPLFEFAGVSFYCVCGGRGTVCYCG